MSVTFDISPEKEGSQLQFFYRQLFLTPTEVRDVDLSGKTAIVTGSNSGVGKEVSRQLLGLGLSKLILAVRNEDSGNQTAAELANATAKIEAWKLDYADYDSILAFIERAKSLDRIDIVVLNAGILPKFQRLNPRTGHEDSIQINYLSTVLIATLLLPLLKAKKTDKPARITIVSSDVGSWAKFEERKSDPLLPALDTGGKWNSTERHFTSKLLPQLYVAELAKRVPPSVAVINMTTPGMVHDSRLSREIESSLAERIVEFIRRRIGHKASVGARLVVDAAVKHGEETHGQYLSAQRLKPMAPIVYTGEGQRVRERLWKETMAEFQFAQIEKVVEEVSDNK